jgi:hypothetical protein
VAVDQEMKFALDDEMNLNGIERRDVDEGVAVQRAQVKASTPTARPARISSAAIMPSCPMALLPGPKCRTDRFSVEPSMTSIG